MISRMGPNSPMAPAASRKVPKRVRSRPLSLRIGISVPIAVVASAEPVNSSDSTMPVSASRPPIRGGERQREQPAQRGQAQRVALDALEVDLIAGEEEQEPETQAGEELDELVRAPPGRAASGPTTMPSTISITTTGTARWGPTKLQQRRPPPPPSRW